MPTKLFDLEYGLHSPDEALLESQRHYASTAPTTHGDSLASPRHGTSALSATMLLSSLQDTPCVVPIFGQGVLRCLDPSSCARLQAVSVAARSVAGEAAEYDFQVQMGRVLLLREKHKKRFQQQVREVEKLRTIQLLWWVGCLFVLMPLALTLRVDFRVLPRWAIPIPMVLSLPAFFFPSGFRQTPHTGARHLQTHEAMLWKVTEEKLYSKGNRFFLKCWGMAVTIIPLWGSICYVQFPNLRALPYASLLPAILCVAYPIWKRHALARNCKVTAMQTGVSIWMVATAAMTWCLAFDSDVILTENCTFYFCGAGGNIGILVGVVLFSVLVVATTIAYPFVFVLVNLYKGWKFSAIGGLCGLAMECSLLVSLGMQVHGKDYPAWATCIWIIFGGLLACVRLLADLLKDDLGFLESRGAVARSRGEEFFVLPPLLPPTISSTPFTPRWNEAT